MELDTPKLLLSDASIEDVLADLVDASTLIVTDYYDYSGIPDYVTRIRVKEQHADHIENVKQNYSYDKIIGIGGCTALDFARACAIGKELYLIPAILSNACLSTNRSVINYGGVYRTEITTTPKRTIVCVPEIMKRHAIEGSNWTAAGFGDLFSALSASIEVAYEENGLSLKGVTLDTIVSPVYSTWEALQWIADIPADQSLHTSSVYKRLATCLHDSSVDVIRNGHTRLNAGSEHKLYYALQERYQYEKSRATHGHLVSIGTLLTTAIFYVQTGDGRLYNTMLAAYRRLGLPISYDAIGKIGVQRVHLEQGLKRVHEKSTNDFYTQFIPDLTVVDRIFGESLTREA